MIPDGYNTLPGFRTVYSETELRLAIAITETAGLTGAGIATLGEQISQTTLLQAILDLQATIDEQRIQSDYLRELLDASRNLAFDTTEIKQGTNALRTRSLQVITGQTSASGQILAPPSPGNRYHITDLIVQNEATGTQIVTITVGGAANRVRFHTTRNGEGLKREYPPGRELQLAEGEAITLTLSAPQPVGYCITYYIAF